MCIRDRIFERICSSSPPSSKEEALICGLHNGLVPLCCGQREARARFFGAHKRSDAMGRKNAKAVLASLGLALVEGVRMGDAPLRSAHSFEPAFGVL